MKLIFGQQHTYSLPYFGKNWHNIDMIDSPHYSALKDNSFIKYIEYIETSHKHPNHKNSMSTAKWCEKYDSLIDLILKDKIIKKPIKVTHRISDNVPIVLDGNHRSSIGLFYDIKFKMNETDPLAQIENISLKSKSFFGSQHRNKPYQSLYYKNNLIVEGRRSDFDRIHLINPADIKNKSVVDFGCNYGELSRQCINMGATAVTGLEYDYTILDSAIRISVILDNNPNFILKDLRTPFILPDKYDTGLCLSVHRHVNNNHILARNLANNIKSVLYFETHVLKEPIPHEILEYFTLHSTMKTDDGRGFYKLIRNDKKC